MCSDSGLPARSWQMCSFSFIRFVLRVRLNVRYHQSNGLTRTRNGITLSSVRWPSPINPRKPSAWKSRRCCSAAPTPAPAARVECLEEIAHHESQIMLRIHRSIPRWRIVFSTFFQCMSFYTARVMNGPKADVRVESALPRTADIDRRGWHVAFVPIPHSCTAATANPHSMIVSARSRKASGILSPNVLAVVRLTTRSNLVGCSTGISAGFAPRRILST